MKVVFSYFIDLNQLASAGLHSKSRRGKQPPSRMETLKQRWRDDDQVNVVFLMSIASFIVDPLHRCKEQDHSNLVYLINKPPRWNERKSHALF
jgi:hypothetical protein